MKCSTPGTEIELLTRTIVEKGIGEDEAKKLRARSKKKTLETSAVKG